MTNETLQVALWLLMKYSNFQYIFTHFFASFSYFFWLSFVLFIYLFLLPLEGSSIPRTSALSFYSRNVVAEQKDPEEHTACLPTQHYKEGDTCQWLKLMDTICSNLSTNTLYFCHILNNLVQYIHAHFLIYEYLWLERRILLTW